MDTPVRNLIVLGLVCKLWRSIVEGTPSLWNRISGKEELPCLRKALAMAKDIPLEIKYWEKAAKTNNETFFAEIGARVVQWKSVAVTARNWDPALAILKTVAAPNLTRLSLKVPWDQDWDRGVVTLFGGEPASPALKDFRAEFIPVAIAPLRLSGLRSLELKKMPVVSESEVLRVLMYSPALERCALSQLTCLTEVALPSQHQELRSSCSRSRAGYPIIQLLHLHYLVLHGLPVSFIHPILSVIRAPNLGWFSVECRIDQDDQSPTSELLTAEISHLIPALKALTSKAEYVEITSFSELDWTIWIGRLIIGLGGRRLQINHMQETLGWVFANLGGHLETLPVSLNFREFHVSSDWFIWLASRVKVTKLELWTGSLSTPEPDPQPRKVISLLSQPLVSANNQWLLPDLESIKTNVVNEEGKSKILEMVNARHSFIREQRERRPESVVLKPFQKIWLRGGKNDVSSELGPNIEFLMALQEEGGDAEIWWDDVKWTGTEGAGYIGQQSRSGCAVV